jgi:hypothetical protein
VVWGFRKDRSGDAPASTDGSAAGRSPPPSQSVRDRRGDESRRRLPVAAVARKPARMCARHSSRPSTRPAAAHRAERPNRSRLSPPQTPIERVKPIYRLRAHLGSTVARINIRAALDGAVTIGPILQSLQSRRPISC